MVKNSPQNVYLAHRVTALRSQGIPGPGSRTICKWTMQCNRFYLYFDKAVINPEPSEKSSPSPKLTVQKPSGNQGHHPIWLVPDDSSLKGNPPLTWYKQLKPALSSSPPRMIDSLCSKEFIYCVVCNSSIAELPRSHFIRRKLPAHQTALRLRTDMALNLVRLCTDVE
jgi:hypothetical protein